MPSQSDVMKILTGPAITGDYEPPPMVMHGMFMMTRRKPRFSKWMIVEMLEDPRVIFGLWLIKGPILSESRFYIKTEDPEIKKFLIKNVSRFWRSSASRALKAVEWGFSGSEVIYNVEDDKLQFDTLADLHPFDTKPNVKKGRLTGIQVSNVPDPDNADDEGEININLPKAFWHVHSREYHSWFGRSRLFGGYPPWWEMVTEGGFKDTRRLYHHKYAFDGGTLYHPTGNTKDENGQLVSYRVLATRIMNKKRTGGDLILPNTSRDGVRSWEYQHPQVTAHASNIQEYGNDLKDEVWEGMGIPPEVARAEGTGAFAGRRIPQQAFYSILQEIVQWLMFDYNKQVLQFLVNWNFGEDHAGYEIIPFGLTRNIDDEGQVTTREIPQGAELPKGGEAQLSFVLCI